MAFWVGITCVPIPNILCPCPINQSMLIQWPFMHILIIWGQWHQLNSRQPLNPFFGGHMCAVPIPLLPKCHENPSRYGGTVSYFASVNIFGTHIKTIIQGAYFIIPLFLTAGTTSLWIYTSNVGPDPIGKQPDWQINITSLSTNWVDISILMSDWQNLVLLCFRL